MGKTPSSIRTFRVRGMSQCKRTCEGLINHRQWFTFRPILETSYPHDEYEFDLDSETPESGYGFQIARDADTYQENSGYGLEVAKGNKGRI